MPMPLHITWEQIGLRLLLAAVASLLIGFNRDEQGHPAGIRTTMLTCLAATLAMIQVNLLLPQAGKTLTSFNVMDLLRLPLGVLTGVGFIGAGVIVKRDGELVSGVTTAATMWYVTMLGLLFGGGQIYTAISGTLLALVILWLLGWAETFIPRHRTGTLRLELGANAPTEDTLRRLLTSGGFIIVRWNAHYEQAQARATVIECELRRLTRTVDAPVTPPTIESLREVPDVNALDWRE